MPKEPKTKLTGASVADFLAGVEHPRRRGDAEAICGLLQRVSGSEPEMWGSAIVGFGRYGTSTGEWPRMGFSPRKANLVLYLGAAFAGRDAVVARLGGVKTQGGCIYVTDLAKVDAAALEDLVRGVWAFREGATPP